MRLQTLYGKSSTGKIKVCNISVENNCEVVTEHGYEEGKMQRSVVKIKQGKNLGKSNETTIREQAMSEAKSKWESKRDKNYVTSKTELEAQEKILPMCNSLR